MIYIGSLVMFIGITLAFYAKAPAGLRRNNMHSRHSTTFMLLAALTFGALRLAPDAHADALAYARRIPIQHAGRVQSFDVFAEQQLELISGKSNWNGEPAAAVCAARAAAGRGLRSWRGFASIIPNCASSLRLRRIASSSH